MQSIIAGDLVLVTGATGYVAAHVIDQLLKKGYRVRGTVRSLSSSKTDYLRSRFQEHTSNLELVEATDLEADGVFDQAVQGVQGIAHIASPCHYDINDAYIDLVNPAVTGTVSLLRSAHLFGKYVKTVVITSSTAAIIKPTQPGYRYTEDDWNDSALTQLKIEYAAGGRVDAGNAYRASKTVAEREAWNFMQKEDPRFTLAAINPANIFGPVIQEIKDVNSINLSVGLLFSYLSGHQKEVGENAAAQSFVDVRDVALMHTRALERSAAAGKRFVSTSSTFTYQQIVDILRKTYPDQAHKIPLGRPGEDYNTLSRYDNSRAKNILGLSFIGLEKSVLDTFESLAQFAWMRDITSR